MYELIYHPRAINELDEAMTWYENRQPGRGEKFLACIIEKMLHLQQQFGGNYPVRRGWLREFFVGTYPYLIIYRINRRKKHLVIARIFHTSRNPNKRYR